MTATGPVPPPHLTPVQPMNGGASDRGTNGNQPPHYPHIKDLFERAESQIPYSLTTRQLVDKASNAYKTANDNLTYRRPDYALVEFIIAQRLITDVIPARQDFYALRKNDPSLQKQYDKVFRALEHSKDLDGIGTLIKRDNQLSGILPRSAKSSNNTQQDGQVNRRSTATRAQDRPQSVQRLAYPDDPPMTNGVGHERAGSASSLRGGDYYGQSATRTATQEQRPQSLQSRAVAQSNQSSSQNHTSQPKDPLLDRFSSMRVSSPPPEPSNYGSRPSRPQSQPSTNGYRPRVSVQSSLSKDLPRPPSPTYSPAKGMPDNMDFKTSQRNSNSITAFSDTTSHAATSSLSQQTFPDRPDSNDSRYSQRSSTNTIPAPNPQAENTPQETEIRASRLFDYLNQFNVLVIDVRNRENFDSGHIFHRNIICIEPTALRPHKSADELQEALVLGPEKEYELFDRRHDFDLVVYYDDSTKSAGFLSSRSDENNPLKCLHDSLYHYNHDKALKHQPILLAGGLDSWIDLAGPQSLQTSSTIGSRTQGVKPSRPIARRPPASHSSRLSVNRKRHRDYNPLAPEEERKWRERARSESVAVELPTQDQADPSNQDGEPVQLQRTGTYDDFQSRYPDVASVESQALNARPPSRPPPDAPRIPSYPTPPPPTVPSRPPPALPRPSYSGVRERAITQTAASRTSDLRPYIPPKLLKLPRTGLHNFGVTCYMNATIQCLSATLPLTLFFLDGHFKKSLQTENWKGSKGIMPQWYNTLLTNLWRPGDAETIRPTNFRKFCARLNKEWGLDRQQDAKEFLDFLIDTLHEDLNTRWSRTPLQALTPEKEAQRERTPPFIASKGEFYRYLHRDASKLTDLFAGQHISRLQCTSCGHSSTTYETFYSISVEIPTPRIRGQPVSLHDCLKSYTTSETLTGDETWRCPHCRTDREATKRLTLTRAPEFLVIHLKRFSASHSEKARKVHTSVDFPLRGLDLAPYMLPPPPDPNSEQGRYLAAKDPDGGEVPVGMRPPYRYDCYAVMRHLGGTMGSGHYVALVEDKSSGRWREFNDERVGDFDAEGLGPTHPGRLQNEEAYIVFYQRVWG